MSERAKIDKESRKHRETTDPSREEQLSLLQTITMEVAAARDFVRLGNRAPTHLREDGLGARTGLVAESRRNCYSLRTSVR
jgi:hypothetical protein